MPAPARDQAGDCPALADPQGLLAQCGDLLEGDGEVIASISGSLPVVADLSRADALVYCRRGPDQLVIV
ncbi:MAG: histidine kinase N-terminal domain-containing protein, partial [Chloroflexota bacterium]